MEGVQTLGGVLFKVFLSEDACDFFAEINVVNERCVSGILDCVVIFKTVVLYVSELNLLTVQRSSELGWRNCALSKDVVVLEEFKQTDAVSLDDVFYFLHQLLELALAVVVNKFGRVGALGECGWTVNFKFKNIAVLQKFGILYFTSLAAIH